MLITIICLGSGICYSQANSITVETDKQAGTDFSQYKTFGFSPMIDSDLDVRFFFVGDLILKTRVREAIAEELMGLGYLMDRKEPDLVVSFRVFDKATTLTAIDEDGGRFWGGLKYTNIGELKHHDVKAGTLMMSFADRESSQVVFQGFASGLINNNKFINEEVKIREAVNMIINEYDHRAKEYTRK